VQVKEQENRVAHAWSIKEQNPFYFKSNLKGKKTIIIKMASSLLIIDKFKIFQKSN
jgi:hypothetical protein